MAGVGDVFQPGGADAGNRDEISPCARSQAPFVFLSKFNLQRETD